MWWPRGFGGLPSLERMQQSPHFADGAFVNPEPTDMRLQGASFAKVFWEFFFRKPRLAVPPGPIPVVRGAQGPGLVWFGHSSYMIVSPEARIVVDPVFSLHTSPFSFGGAKAFPGTEVFSVADLGVVDILVLTHDHYDHLDYKTVSALKPGVVVTALGVGAHLKRWGYPASRIVELDWGASVSPRPGVTFTATPARHFSGRRFKRNQTLWTSFVLQLGDLRIFLGGDSGYGAHFGPIGAEHGPFDLAILECGQYGVHWPFIHMFPEQTWKAAVELRARELMPVHWGKFSLSLHEWDEPIRRLVAVSGPLVTPRPGEVVPLGGPYPRERWWEALSLPARS
jgi:L-ascorbate metabolism protein UlaG (beta-lactamase superfamily)